MTSAKQVDLVKCDDEASSEPLYLHLSITDPEVVAAMTDAGEGRGRQEFAQTALRIGVLSLKAARGTIDGGTIRGEGERLLLTLEERLSGHRQVAEREVRPAGNPRQFRQNLHQSYMGPQKAKSLIFR